MLPEKTLAWGRARNCIREVSEYGTIRRAEIGADKVYDFSLGNPSVPAPACVNESIIELIKSGADLHGYTTAAGLPSLREKIAENINERFNLGFTADRLYVTTGAAAGLCIALRAILFPGQEVIAPAPYFPEDRVFTEASGGVLVPVSPREDMQINLEAVAAALNERTRAVIFNSPNNPSGTIFDEENLRGLAELLREHEAKTGNTVYVISDEPYRELVYDGAVVHTILEYYDDAFMCYSFSKAMSIPGERIGYIGVNPRMKDAQDVYHAVMGAARALGYVNPPSLFQYVIEKCIGQVSDIEVYRKNRDLLCAGLEKLGYEFIMPRGAFYLFLKALEPDSKAFCEHAKKHELLLVPADDFGAPGWARIAYCVDTDLIERAMPAFEALIADYKG